MLGIATLLCGKTSKLITYKAHKDYYSSKFNPLLSKLNAFMSKLFPIFQTVAEVDFSNASRISLVYELLNIKLCFCQCLLRNYNIVAQYFPEKSV